MKNDDFNTFLLNTIECDKSNITVEKDNFDSLWLGLKKHQNSESIQRKLISYGGIPVILCVLLMNISFMFAQSESHDTFQSMETFAEENGINTSANYFSEVLLSFND